jgi:hypothetical protein
MRGVPSIDDGLTGGAIRYRWNRIRPAFMEPLGGTPGVPQGVPPGVPPPNGGNYVRLVEGGGGGGGGGGVGWGRVGWVSFYLL